MAGAFDQPQTGLGDPSQAPQLGPQGQGKQTGGQALPLQQQNLRMPTIGAPPGGGPQFPSDGPQPVTIDAVMVLLRDGATRRFRIDIETDSTVAGNEAQDRQDRIALITAATQMVETWAPIVGANPIAAPLAGALMLFGVRGFRIGTSEIEDVIETFVDKMEQNANQPKPPPQPDPAEQAKLQATQIKSQTEIAKARIALQEAQLDSQARMREVAMEHDKGIMDSRMANNESIMEHRRELQRMQAEHNLAMAEQQAKLHLASQQHAQKMTEKLTPEPQLPNANQSGT